MRIFECRCGQSLYFDNHHCEHCGRSLGFDMDQLLLVAADDAPQSQFCENRTSHIQCNWLVDKDDSHAQCVSCRLTRTLPPESEENNARLAKLEAAKRRWLYGVLRLNIPVPNFHDVPDGGLAFDFLEDQGEKRVITGHANGLITLNIAEADPIERVFTRERMNEQYRTLVGHFRHESGHFFWDQLVRDSDYLTPCRTLFGDDRLDYAEALESHYQQGETDDWKTHFVSHYASSHPWEDWAETWAHYLHISDTMETAASFALCAPWETLLDDVEALIAKWGDIAIMLNEMNRSMGQNDSYPFVLPPPVVEKLHFVHQVVHRVEPA